jgi:hypothetical protein
LDISFILFLSLIAIGVFKGFKSGWIKIVSQVVSLLLAYVITYIFVDPFAGFLSSISPLKGLLATMVGGLGLFVITSSITAIIVTRLLKLLTKKSSKKTMPSSAIESSIDSTVAIEPTRTARASSRSNAIGTNDKIIGAILGGILGAFSGVFIGWLYTAGSQIFMQQRGDVKELTTFQQASQTIVNKLAEVAATNLAGDSTLVEGSGVLLTNPAENMRRLKNVQKSGVLARFFNSGSVQQALSSRNAKRVLDTDEFKRLFANNDFNALAKQFSKFDSNQALEKATAIKITELWNQIDQVRYSSEFQDLLHSAEVQSMSRSYNLFSMLNSDKVERLLELIANAPKPDIKFDHYSSQLDSSVPIQKKTEVYRWVDENGKVHYSDKKKQ